MSREAYIRASVAVAVLPWFSKILRDAVVADLSFTKSSGISADGLISFGGDGAEFQRSLLFATITDAFEASPKAVEVIDAGGDAWQLRTEGAGRDIGVVLSQGVRRIRISGFGMLSPDRDLRLSVFSNTTAEMNLPAAIACRWTTLLEERAPSADELTLIQHDFNYTPVAVSRAILESLTSGGGVSLKLLIPQSEQYYEQLIGKYRGELTLDEYIERTAPEHFKALVGWQAVDGLKLAALAACQPSITATLAEIQVPDGAWAQVMGWLASSGDVLSRAAVAEIGLSRQDRDADQPLATLIRAVAENQEQANVDPFELTSALILAVYGEIAHARILAAKPPFWRRLAAIAQASIIARCLIQAGHDATQIVEWLMSFRPQSFLLQSYADLRQEPRFLPEFALPDQLRNEIYGRVLGAANNNRARIGELGLNELLDDGEGGLKQRFEFMQGFLPGLLEGGVPSPHELPDNIVSQIEQDLSSATITIDSFTRLVNGGMLFRTPAGLADLASEAIARADYQVAYNDKPKFIGQLLGLASVAAVTRSHKLADALFTLLRVSRRFRPNELTLDDVFRIAIVASASRSELMEWCKCVGDFVIELAFQQLEHGDAEHLLSHLTHLCHLVPELWSTCGQAEAALRAMLLK